MTRVSWLWLDTGWKHPLFCYVYHGTVDALLLGMKTATEKVLDTMTRRDAGISCQLIETPKGYIVRSKVGRIRRENGPMSRRDAGELWEGLQKVGMPTCGK